MRRLKRRPDRLLILAQRARQFAKDDSGLVAELYREHAAICEAKAAAEMLRRKKSKSRRLATD
jgi:hypothetical protein